METKFDIMGNLPPDLLSDTARYLSNQVVVNVASASTQHLQLFKPFIEHRKLSQFLHHVTHGNHDAVRAMLLAGDMSLFYKKGQVTDCSGRTFANISGFEYALWALDKHMWSCILECVPETEEGLLVWRLLKGQYGNLVQKGVTYTLNGQAITKTHFDFENTIIKELQTQVGFGRAQGAAIYKQWAEGVGGAQRLFPWHVAAVYCSDEPFHPMPQFTSQPKSTTQFYNGITGQNENWFCDGSKLGADFAIYRGGSRPMGGHRGGMHLRAPGAKANLDLGVMVELCKVRTEDFIALESYLEARLVVDRQAPACQM